VDTLWTCLSHSAELLLLLLLLLLRTAASLLWLISAPTATFSKSVLPAILLQLLPSEPVPSGDAS
jgi:hypothetical protein